MLEHKIRTLQNNLMTLGSGLVALSGGVDSSVLLVLASGTENFQVKAVTARSLAHPAEEIDAAIALCELYHIEHIIFDIDELKNPDIRRNDPNRCYHCKLSLYEKFLELAREQSLSVVLDGSNVDDTNDYRPGYAAIKELQIATPLIDAGFTKADIRKIAQQNNLSMMKAPASACLFTRIPTGEPLDRQRLVRIYQAERIVKQFGFDIVRIRDHHDIARIEIEINRFPEILKADVRDALTTRLKEVGYRYICLDLCGYSRGSNNAVNT